MLTDGATAHIGALKVFSTKRAKIARDARLHWAVAEADPGSNFHDLSVRIQRGIAMLYGLINETLFRITHIDPGPGWFASKEGEASVFRPDGSNNLVLVARVQAAEWIRAGGGQ